MRSIFIKTVHCTRKEKFLLVNPVHLIRQYILLEQAQSLCVIINVTEQIVCRLWYLLLCVPLGLWRKVTMNCGQRHRFTATAADTDLFERRLLEIVHIIIIEQPSHTVQYHGFCVLARQEGPAPPLYSALASASSDSCVH